MTPSPSFAGPQAGRFFIKMHGLQNHFVIVDAREEAYRPDAEEIIQICDQNTGIGGDQLLIIQPPTDSTKANAFMRITGVEDLAQQKQPPSPIDETDVESEFEDDTPPPDPTLAKTWWEAHRENLDPALRWQGGVAVDSSATDVVHSLAVTRDLHLFGRATAIELTAERELERRLGRAD